jgi:hypothetical protein
VKGVYKLKEGSYIPSAQEAAKGSVRLKLIYILSQLEGKQGDILSIKKAFVSNFNENLDFKVNADSQLAVWEKTMLKTLSSSPEFDVSSTKTVYASR